MYARNKMFFSKTPDEFRETLFGNSEIILSYVVSFSSVPVLLRFVKMKTHALPPLFECVKSYFWKPKPTVAV